ncbi:MAG: hypothetical protein ACR2L1_05975 [Pyrinomonadaceae bacterium]
MRKRNLPPSSRNEKVKRQRDPLPWRYCILTLVCGLLLVAGFFFAAQQHFTAMGFGIKNAKLRQQKEELLSEQRRLYLSREISLAPAEIKKAAKKIGLQEFTASSIQYVSSKVEKINPLAEKKSADKPQIAVQPKNADAKEVKSKTEKTAAETKTDKSKDEKSKATVASGGDIRPRTAKK